MKPAIAVVIPTYNRPSGLKQALHSVYSQTILPDEIVVVDDGSDDAVSEDVFLDCPSTIRHTLLRNTSPSGANVSRNRGVACAGSDYVSLLDDDDAFHSEKISRLRSALEEGSLDLITHRAIVHIEPIGVSYTIHPRIADFQGQLVSNTVGTTSMVTVRKDFFLSCGGFDEALPARQDYEAWLRALKNGARMTCIDEPLCVINAAIKRRSVSTSLENNVRAMEIIDEKYADDISLLSASERKRREVAKANFMIHKFLLNADGLGAFIYGLKTSLRLRDLKLFAVSVLSILGPRTIFGLYSRRAR